MLVFCTLRVHRVRGEGQAEEAIIIMVRKLGGLAGNMFQNLNLK